MKEGNIMETALSVLRGLKEFSQRDLAARTGLTEKTIGNYEKDVKKFRGARYENVEKIANVLEVSVDDLFLKDTSVFLKQVNKNQRKKKKTFVA